MGKKQIEKITLKQESGPSQGAEASSWEEADEIIKSFAGHGSVKIILDFGTEQIKYTYDSIDSAMPLRTAVRRWVEYIANITKPSWMSDEEWDDFKIGNDDFAPVYREWLEDLDI